MSPPFQADQKKETLAPQDDSDLEKKRREAEVLLQSMGITPEAPVGESWWHGWGCVQEGSLICPLQAVQFYKSLAINLHVCLPLA